MDFRARLFLPQAIKLLLNVKSQQRRVVIFRDDIVPTRLQAELHSTIHHSLLLDCSALVVLCCVLFVVW